MGNRGRSGVDELLATALARGLAVQAAADKAGVSVRTAHRRLTDPAFRDRVSALRSDMVNAAAGRLAGAMADAASVLAGLMTSETERIRLRAADLTLQHAVRLSELADLERRLVEVENLFAEQANRGSR